MQRYKIIDETISYATDPDKTNTDPRFLVAGSQNVLINRERKVVTRNGFTRLGAGSETANPIKNQKTWSTSTGQEWMLRNYDDELEVWIDTHDSVALNAWYRVANSFPTTEIIRMDFVWKDSETLDTLVFVAGDDNLYEWSGGVAVASSITTNSITKKGTNTFAQNRFYVNGGKSLVNARTGTVYAYTGGEGTTTLTGVTPDPTGDILEDDVLVQQVVTHGNEPASGRNNHTIGVFQNQALIGSNDDNEVYMTANDDITDTTFSAPRIAGEGALFTLDGPSKGIASFGNQFALFAGKSSVFRSKFTEITVGSTLTEVVDVKKILTGTNQGSFSADTIIELGNAVMYLSNEPAWRSIQDPDELEGVNPRTLSNPILPDFNSEDFTNAHAEWYKNSVYLTAPNNSRLFILVFVEDANGVLRRFWQPPQILPVRSLSVLNAKLYAGSNGVQETYELFAKDTYSDLAVNGTAGEPNDKIPINAIASFAYDAYGDRANYKVFDEYFIEGEIRPNTKINTLLNYDFGGVTQVIEEIIDGANNDILEEPPIQGSLGQPSLGNSPLGGLLTTPEDASQFNVTLEEAREDFKKLQVIFSSNGIDQFWSILSRGPNVEKSRRRDTVKRL